MLKLITFVNAELLMLSAPGGFADVGDALMWIIHIRMVAFLLSTGKPQFLAVECQFLWVMWGYKIAENGRMAKKQPDYAALRKILEKDIGKKYADQLSDEDIEALGNFLVDCTHTCRLQGHFF